MKKGIILLFLGILFASCTLSKDEKRAIITDAVALSQEGKDQEAIYLLEYKFKKRNRGYTYYLYHGIFLKHLDVVKNTSLALDDFKRAYQIDSQNFMINFQLGSAYSDLGEYDTAIPFLEAAQEFADKKQLHFVKKALSLAYLMTGDINAAESANNVVMSENPDAFDYLQQGIILSFSQGKEILDAYYQKAKQALPSDIGTDSIMQDEILLSRTYGSRLIQMGLYDDAEALLNQFTDAYPEGFDWCYADRGFIYLLKKQFDTAKKNLDKALSLNNAFIPTLNYMSFYFYKTGNMPEAYKFEAWARLQRSPGNHVYYLKTIEEYKQAFANSWEFKLLESQ